MLRLRGKVIRIFKSKSGKSYYVVEVQPGSTVNVSVDYCQLQVDLEDEVLVEVKAIRYGDSVFLAGEIIAQIGG